MGAEEHAQVPVNCFSIKLCSKGSLSGDLGPARGPEVGESGHTAICCVDADKPCSHCLSPITLAFTLILGRAADTILSKPLILQRKNLRSLGTLQGAFNST